MSLHDNISKAVDNQTKKFLTYFAYLFGVKSVYTTEEFNYLINGEKNKSKIIISDDTAIFYNLKSVEEFQILMVAFDMSVDKKKFGNYLIKNLFDNVDILDIDHNHSRLNDRVFIHKSKVKL